MAEKTFADLEAALEAVRSEWDGLSTNPKLRFDSEREWVLQACNRDAKATACALGNVIAVAEALRNVAGVGITLDPAQKLAYVYQRDGKMVFDASYMGLLEIAVSSGSIQWAQAHRVYEIEVPGFKLQGYDRPPLHDRNPWVKPDQRGEVVGAYVVVKTHGGDYLTSTMHIDEINGIRARSPSFKGSEGKKGPWVTDAEEMEKKTVVKNAYKYWPRSERLDRAIHYLNTDGGQGIELAGEAANHTAMRTEWLFKAREAATIEDLGTIWNEGRKVFKEAEDGDGLTAFRSLVEKRRVDDFGGGTKPAATPAPTTAPAPAAAAKPPATRAAAPTGPPKGSFADICNQLRAATTETNFDAISGLMDKLPADQLAEATVFYNETIARLWPEAS